MNDSRAAALSLSLGVLLVALVTFSLMRLRTDSARERAWMGLESVADALHAVGFDKRFTTRGFYVNMVALATLGTGFLVAGLIGVLSPQSELVAPIGVAGVFGFGLVSAVSVVVARTGRPQRWIPRPYWKGHQRASAPVPHNSAPIPIDEAELAQHADAPAAGGVRSSGVARHYDADGQVGRQVTRLVSRYVAMRTEWAELPSAEFRKANKIFRNAHKVAKELRETEEGRAGLLSLLTEGNGSVRLGAATESLPIDPAAALAVIDDLAGSNSAEAFSASMVAQEWRAGRLNPDR